jgi:photosystem II stability/assembly factor-like uncharacterized protein
LFEARIAEEVTMSLRILPRTARRWLFVVVPLALIALLCFPAATAVAGETRISPFSGGGANLSSAPTASGRVSPAAASPVVQQFQETSYYFRDLAFANENTGLAVGYPHWDDAAKESRATIVKTSDGGLSWQPVAAGAWPLLSAVAFPDPLHAWAVGAGGVILHTADGGVSWSRQSVATDEEFLAVAFADTAHGWVASERVVHTDWQGDEDDWRATVWQTSDGGATWSKATLPEDAGLIHDVEAVDARHAWAVGVRSFKDQYGRPDHYPVIYRTSDGGASWKLAYSPELHLSLTAVDFVDPMHGWVSGFPTLSTEDGGATFATSDGGVTWRREELGTSSFRPIWDIRFIDTDRGYAVGADYVAAWGPPVYRTTDGGNTWTLIRMDLHNNDGLFGVGMAGDHVVALGDHDYVVRSGHPWGACETSDCVSLFSQRYLNTHYLFHDVDFVDANRGWAVGSKTVDVEAWAQTIFQTVDGGAHWTEQFQHRRPDTDWSYHRLDGIAMVDAQAGWAVGTTVTWREGNNYVKQGGVWHTTDGGAHWVEQGQTLKNDWDIELSAVSALSGSEAWALEENGDIEGHVRLAHTTDAGEHWQWVDTGISGNVAVGYGEPQGALKFTDAQHGWVGTFDGALRTSDGGAHWATMALSCGYPACYPASQAIDFAGNRGWLAGDNLWRTDDGATWIDTKIAPHPERGQLLQFYDIQFLDSRNGWAAGNGGSLLFTPDAGDRWGWMPYTTDFNIYGTDFLQPELGWAVGDAGIILKIGLPHFPPVQWVYLPFLRK